jgi:two-component system NtrC family sensor kinase
MHASILIVGHPFPDRVEFGADHSHSYDQALEVLSVNKYAVLVANDRLSAQSRGHVNNGFEFLMKCRNLNSDMQIVLMSPDASPQELQQVINAVGIFKTIESFDANLLQLAVREALEEYELIKQNQAFLALTQEQNQRLQHLSVLLEEKVKAREEFLVEAREKLLNATRRTEALNRALVAIQKSVSKLEIEQLLNDALHVALGLTWTKILFKGSHYRDHVNNDDTQDLTIFSAPLLRQAELLGHIYFARSRQKPFSNDEDDFLLQISDAVGLAIDRLMALEAIEELKQEWDSTFDSITDPVSIIDQDYKIIRANKAFAEKSQIPLQDLSEKKCYEALFSRSQPCTNCKLGQSFDLGETHCSNQSSVQFSVSSHIVDEKLPRRHFAMFYHDIIDQERMQRQILESSKMAEIGTIGSSIAHEINNPLGGMIAFLQILKSELTVEDKMFTDIVEMEKAAIRCKTIVENLLAFTRKSSSSDMQITRLGELVKLVTNIMELQTRGLGIQIEKLLHDSDIKVKTDTNQLVQVLVNVMQNSCEALAERLSGGKRQPPPKILIKSGSTESDKLFIEITDNGTGIPSSDLPRVFTPFFTTKDKTKNPGLGLSVSYQIVKEHEGQMEISSVFGQSTTVVLTLPVAKSLTT